MPKSRADVWLGLFEITINRVAGDLGEDEVGGCAIAADSMLEEFDWRFKQTPGNRFVQRDHPKPEGDPAPTIEVKPSDDQPPSS